MKMDLSNCQE